MGSLEVGDATVVSFGGFPALESLGALRFENASVGFGDRVGLSRITALPQGLTLTNTVVSIALMPALRSVGGAVVIGGNALVDNDVNRLVGGVSFGAFAGDIRFEAAGQLTTVPLSSLTSATSLTLKALPLLRSLRGVVNVTSVSAALDISDTGVRDVDVVAFHDGLVLRPVTFTHSGNAP